MPADLSTLLAIGIGAAILLWLVFSLIKKLFVLALVAALAFGAYIAWTDPELVRRTMAMLGLA